MISVRGLPASPLAAAAVFHADVLPGLLRGTQTAPLTLHFAAADHTHRAWRAAVVAELARAMAPRRVNALAGGGAAQIAAATAYIAAAPGVTGQLLQLGGEGGGDVLEQR